MPASLLRSPDARRPLFGGDEPPTTPPAVDTGGDGRPPRPPRRRVPVAALLMTSALLGGGASAGILTATGALDASSTTTVIQRSSAATSSAGAASFDAGSLYASVASGVVDITAKGTTTDRAQSPFGGVPQQQSTATGTGFVIDGDGHIVTAAHVVDGASSVTVTLENGTTRKATVTGTDDATDVAVLKIDPSGLDLTPLKLGSSASLGIGDTVAAVGDPFGYTRSLSTGIVSGLDRTIEAPNGFTVAHAIQTDAAVNPGNSGGPLLNAQGEVVGIVDQIATDGSSEQSSGVGFAVPIDLVASELSQLKAGKSVEHAYLGVSTSSSAGTSGGVELAAVASGGPAASAGLRAGDVVTKLGDTTVRTQNDLVAAIAEHKPGDQLAVTVRRGNETVRKTVTLGKQPAQPSNG